MAIVINRRLPTVAPNPTVSAFADVAVRVCAIPPELTTPLALGVVGNLMSIELTASEVTDVAVIRLLAAPPAGLH
ncbi:hypothetical protein KBY86_13155 [Synechococcus sp. Lug-A]|uniref:hypothetical protein n=1 Tax=Synechococcus sp. Lug-A TaxID=2823740 RepID=UPI0020CB9598|nr:hypothetical protein [Synechococcus sp. Lug-A]MCP9847828.1 hypothetical protein [Synechococcus sp. Lug-A]